MAKLVKQKYKNPRRHVDVRASPQSAPIINAKTRKILKWKEELKRRKRLGQANATKKNITKPLEVPRKKIVNKFKTPINEPLYSENDFISCNILYYLIQKSSRYLIIDTRQKINYDKSRILSNFSINIPHTEIKQGMPGFYYLEWIQEDHHSYELYTHRSHIYVDVIILLDWDTTKESLTSTTALNVLKDTLKNCDVYTEYGRIKILNGGYNEWLRRYPSFVTNPSVDETDVLMINSNLNNTKASIIGDNDKDCPRRSISKKESKTPVKSSKKSLSKSSQKDVNKYMTPKKSNITEIENVDKKRRSSRRRVTFCEAYIDLTED
ncbi:unnamed protein product [Lasius platythorax]|uniref:Rhodanese domain-containing protein n=1 Tax=Lasius platythorax TaxID=488582 RepID=A0AAV2NLK9_9HYME